MRCALQTAERTQRREEPKTAERTERENCAQRVTHDSTSSSMHLTELKKTCPMPSALFRFSRSESCASYPPIVYVLPEPVFFKIKYMREQVKL